MARVAMYLDMDALSFSAVGSAARCRYFGTVQVGSITSLQEVNQQVTALAESLWIVLGQTQRRSLLVDMLQRSLHRFFSISDKLLDTSVYSIFSN
jgi:hypothetical protein